MTMTGFIRKIVTNGYMPMIPILLWNIVAVPKLPSAFDPQVFNSGIPLSVLIVENIFRTIVFILPLFLKINIDSQRGRQGLLIYIFGCLLYFASWLMLMYAPQSTWSNSIFGFAAPAYLPIIWLVGISFMAEAYYFKISYARWHLIVPSIIFSVFHITHTYLVYTRIV